MIWLRAFLIATLLHQFAVIGYSLRAPIAPVRLLTGQHLAHSTSRIGNVRRHQLSTKLPSTVSSSSSESTPIVEPFGKGLRRDISRKLPFYLSDFTDGFRIKALSSTFFLFFACLAPAIAFGGLLAIATGGTMGTVETVGATAIGGVVYALFSAQPITIIGTTGPLLAFLKVVYDLCSRQGIPFLPVYAWIGLWASLMLFISSFFSLSNVVEYLTEFTDDIFSSLISVIFIIEAVKELAAGFSNPAVSGIQACISLLVAATTFSVATVLTNLRQTPFFPRKMRNLLSDFAPTLGVFAGIFTAKAATARYALKLPMLAVPKLLTTTSGRPWLIDLFAVSNQIKLLCAVPALMAFVLLYMDQNITVRLVMAKDNKLKKGSGLHLDMLVVAAITAFTSVIGMPWMVAATVRSLAHLRSLQEYKPADDEFDFAAAENTSSSSSAGEITGVLEQRFSGVMIHGLIAAAILKCRHLLRQIPVSVLTGLFLYLGTSSIDKTKLWERSLLFITDSRDAARTVWATKVGLGRTKLFTAIQLALLVGMFSIKSTPIGVFFPVLIGLLGPIRWLLEKNGVFTTQELAELDGAI